MANPLKSINALPAVKLTRPVGPFNQIVGFTLDDLFAQNLLNLVKNNVIFQV
jgi:hypothetical protein